MLREIRSDPEFQPTIILLSARAGEDAKVEGLQAGADDYLSKRLYERDSPSTPRLRSPTRATT
ncbi:hypothetical protein JQ615_00150 [Bradyrhizobium jicamae]|uniref:Response regulatory domain-containing protein n=1 Tax=Bradyrhizobium jicamae TaxID=280332 RepID=A0ABS5FAN6_9BRAD|nr:hypothetical protein [Bradyrhizobium jicamae]MBR0933430.1 hypothetical protein [Bradyrhizobium jicamae]